MKLRFGSFEWTLTSVSLMLTALILVTLLTDACHKATYQVHPGALSIGDSQAYDTLLIAQASLKQAKANIQDKVWPDSMIPYIDKVGASYNVALDSYKGYRAALQTASGKGDPAALAQLQSTLQTLSDDLANMFTKAGTPPPTGVTKPQGSANPGSTTIGQPKP